MPTMSKLKKARQVAMLVALVLPGALPGRHADAATQTSTPPAVQFLADPAPMTDFTATTIAGETLKTVNLRGKVILVNFWATWCPPCVTEVPDLVRLQAK